MAKKTSRRPRTGAKTTAAQLPPSPWYAAALFMPVMATISYAMEASVADRLHLREPVAATGEYVEATCEYEGRRRGGRGPFELLKITYEFTAAGYVKPAEYDRPEEVSPRFRTTAVVEYATRAECESALSPVKAAQAPRQIWFEQANPYTAHMVLRKEGPSMSNAVIIGLMGIPFFVIGRLRSLRERRKRLPNHTR